ncbi:MAG: deacylase [Gammaproteobacteria bacterium]|nr:MAG: deacylase [Gammaproteobacteria bacterium]
MRARGRPFTLGGETVAPGERRVIDLPVTRLYTHAPVNLPVQVINGRRAGPRLFITAAVHGDELNGVEICRRLLRRRVLGELRGTLVVVPVVNVFGLIQHSRYLPDRRDLNRSFPGSPRGSLAARLAHLVVSEVVAQCTHGIDLHTGALHRSNLPQIRARLDDPETLALARAFGVPVLLDAALRDGSLREAAVEHGVKILLYEAGEALRFDPLAIAAGVQGVLRVMRALEMLPPLRRGRRLPEPLVARDSAWVRAPASGLIRHHVGLGARLHRGQPLALICDPSDMLEPEEVAVSAPHGGIVIGRSMLPLVNEGDALYHVARFDDPEEAAASVEAFASTIGVDPDGVELG